MKWLKSTSSKAYTACGYTIPAMAHEPVAVNEDTYQQMMNMAVIKSLVKTGGIIVLDKYTAKANISDAATQRLQTLTSENAHLADRNRELENKLATLENSPEKTRAKDVKAAEARASTAEAELAEWKLKYAQLEAEANAKIAELSGEK